MKQNVTRRSFLATAGAAALATTLAQGAGEPPNGNKIKIIGIAASPRKGMTTSKAVQYALDAAKGFDTRIEVELVDLGGLNIAPYSAIPPEDDMISILTKLKSPDFGGLIFGSPCYYRSLSGLAKNFIERMSPLRENKMVLANKPAGVLSVGGFRHGGQEMTIEQIQTALLCFGMIAVGGKAPAFQGATLWNSGMDDIAQDTIGMETAKKLGLHVAEMAVLLRPKTA